MQKYLERLKNVKYRDALLKLYNDYEIRFKEMPASTRFHHKNPGDLHRHIVEVIEISLKIYKLFENELLQKMITEDDVILVAFAHDLEKLNKYRRMKEPKNGQYFEYNYGRTDINDSAIIVSMLAQYGLCNLEDKHLNAFTFHHGGWSVDKGKMKPLAVILHTADLLSTILLGGS